MVDSERNLCRFRQIEAAATAPDVEAATAAALDVERIANDPTEVICEVGGCALTGQHLFDYMLASGRIAPREEIDRVVAPSCAILDVPHDADRELARIVEDLNSPPDEA